MNPGGVIATPSDVAAVVLRLFSGEQSLDNGGALLVDAGGTTARVASTAAVTGLGVGSQLAR